MIRLSILLLTMYSTVSLAIAILYLTSLFSKETRGIINFVTIFVWPFKLLNKFLKGLKFIMEEFK